MTDEPVPETFQPTLLETLPRTDPIELERMNARFAEQRHYSAIGYVAVYWSHFESLIDAACLTLAEIDQRIGTCFTSQVIGPMRKLDAFLSLARELRSLPNELIKELNKFYEKTRGLAEKRNRYVHDVWFFDHPQPPTRLIATARKTLEYKIEETTTETIQVLGTEIAAHVDDFERMFKRIDASPHPSQ